MASSEPHHAPETAGQDSSWSNAPKLSRNVRDLAHRFHALNSVAQPVEETEARSKEVVQDLRELRDQVAWLQHKIHARKLDSLITWVDALRRKVDNRLGDAGKAEQ
jgi:hypothetical protein